MTKVTFYVLKKKATGEYRQHVPRFSTKPRWGPSKKDAKLYRSLGAAHGAFPTYTWKDPVDGHWLSDKEKREINRAHFDQYYEVEKVVMRF